MDARSFLVHELLVASGVMRGVMHRDVVWWSQALSPSFMMIMAGFCVYESKVAM